MQETPPTKCCLTSQQNRSPSLGANAVTGSRSKRKRTKYDDAAVAISLPKTKSRRKHRASAVSSNKSPPSITLKRRKRDPNSTHPSKKKRKKKNDSVKTNLSSRIEAHASREDYIRSRISDPALLIDHHVLLTDEIYKLGVPEKYQGHLFRYVVTGYDSNTNQFDLTYDAQTVLEHGHAFHIDEGAPRETLEKVELETVQKGLELFLNKSNEVNSHSKKETDVIRQSLERA